MHTHGNKIGLEASREIQSGIYLEAEKCEIAHFHGEELQKKCEFLLDVSARCQTGGLAMQVGCS